MKSLLTSTLILAVTAAFSLSAIAQNSKPAAQGHEVGSAAPKQPTEVVAKMTVSSFFHAPGSASSTQIVLDSRGVLSLQTDINPAPQTLGTVSPTILAALQKRIATAKVSELKDENPAAPRCQDGPVSQFVIVQNSQDKAYLASSGCHEFTTSETTTFSDLSALLNAFYQLARLN